MYIKRIPNTLRTFGECFLNTHEIGCEHSANSPRPPRNWLRNTPLIPHVHHEIGCETLRQFPTSTTKLVAKHSAIPHVHHEMGCEHSARRRGPIHRARILTLPITHIRITKYVYIRYQICISTLSITCFHLTTHTSLHYHTNIFVFCYL